MVQSWVAAVVAPLRRITDRPTRAGGCLWTAVHVLRTGCSPCGFPSFGSPASLIWIKAYAKSNWLGLPTPEDFRVLHGEIGLTLEAGKSIAVTERGPARKVTFYILKVTFQLAHNFLIISFRPLHALSNVLAPALERGY